MAGGQLGVGFGLSHSVGVFDARMVRIYRQLGWEPEILGTDGTGRDAISAGLWTFDEAILSAMCRAAGVAECAGGGVGVSLGCAHGRARKYHLFRRSSGGL